MRRFSAILATAMLAVLATSGIGSAGAIGAVTAPATLLRLRGIGPLELGMPRAAALKTGWLSKRGTGCPLGGAPLPITYRFTGPKAPPGIRGVAEFDGGRLRVMSFTGGVRTSAGVLVGRTTVSQMVSRYRNAGFTARARFETTFASTFVTVTQRGRQLIGALAMQGPVSLLAIPFVPVCE